MISLGIIQSAHCAIPLLKPIPWSPAVTGLLYFGYPFPMHTFPITVEAEDVLTKEFQVHAVPAVGTILNLEGMGAFKVKEVQFVGSAEEPLKIKVFCVPTLSF